ncbi:MAG: pyridoxal phosphate-dependent aminotransferase [Candidatus Micrarchaeia archaeon]
MDIAKRMKYACSPIHETDSIVEAMKGKGIDVIKLNAGDPTKYLETPSYIVEAYKKALDEGKNAYASASGASELKDAIASRYARLYNLKIDKSDIIITEGTSEALMFLNAALINNNDSAILFSPYYPDYAPYLQIFGGKKIDGFYDESNNWDIDIENLKAKLSIINKSGKMKKIKYLLLTNPNNPTGTIISRHALEEIVDLAKEYGLFIISDEIYDEIILGSHKFTSMSEIANGVPYMILNGASKVYNATGYRIGYMIIPGKDSFSEELKYRLNDLAAMRLSANTPAQYAIAEAIKNVDRHEQALKAMISAIESRINTSMKILAENPYLSVVNPQAGFYLFPKIDVKALKIKTDKEFVKRFLEEEHVQLTRGSGFGMPDHIRIVALPKEEILAEALERLNKFCNKYKR